MIPIPAEIAARMQVLVGHGREISNSPTTVFNAERLAFLTELSRVLLAHPGAKGLPDVVSFAYWARRANLSRLAEQNITEQNLSMGLGLSFHICPANVPINFAFSMAFGLLSGNSCVVRLPTRNSPTVDVLIEAINELLKEKFAASISRELLIVRFDRDENLSRFWMSVADGRIVWGGDATVEYMRSLPSRPRSREVAFPDRYSFAAINPDAVLALRPEDLLLLCQKLFNDIYLMDQAACSSPQLVVWVGQQAAVESAKARVWTEIERLASTRYEVQPIHVMDKYVQACQIALGNDEKVSIKRPSNYLYRIELDDVSERQVERRGYFGTVHEVTLDTLEPLGQIVNEKYQTLTYFGLDPAQVKDFIARNRLRGIDRVVPIGRALDMDIVWDGYDIISALSRIVVVN